MTKIDGNVVIQLRDALIWDLGRASEDISALTYRRLRIGFADPLARIDQARALLDVIGWETQEPEPPADIDVAAHRPVILRALGEALVIENHLAAESGEAATAQRARASARAATIEGFLRTL